MLRRQWDPCAWCGLTRAAHARRDAAACRTYTGRYRVILSASERALGDLRRSRGGRASRRPEVREARALARVLASHLNGPERAAEAVRDAERTAAAWRARLRLDLLWAAGRFERGPGSASGSPAYCRAIIAEADADLRRARLAERIIRGEAA